MQKTGSILGPYEILSLLGAGGMGEVYRARDTRLDRDVAIKILPETFAHDPERVARFQREAKVLASLSHPNIAGVYGFEEVDDKRFLVMELVEGETLAERLRVGVLPVPEALAIGKQIAEALEAAHERGIIHRDLKPANVKITPEDNVKVLDFGLAKAMAVDDRSSTAIANSPTITAHHTRPGVVLGTAAYMSPEQARGKSVDKRTDIWSFGVVLYECLGGCRPFVGETATDLVAKILEREPDWSTLPPQTPPIVQLLLRRCLAKDRNKRLRDIGDARIDLEQAIADPTSSTLRLGDAALLAADRRIRRGAWRRFAPWVLTGIVSVAAVLTGLDLWRATRPVSRTPIHVDLKVAEGELPRGDLGASFALSPDGNALVYLAGKNRSESLFLRRLDQVGAKSLPGTEDASHPFFSPDGQWVAFFADKKLKKVAVSGGGALTLCDAPDHRGGAWLADGTIIFSPDRLTGLFRIPAGGSSAPPEELTKPNADDNEKKRSHRWPQGLPDGKHVIFTSLEDSDDAESRFIEILDLETRKHQVLHRGGTYGRFLPTGHLVYARDGTLFAAPLDLSRSQLTATPAPILEEIQSIARRGAAQYAFSDSGTLAYHHQKADESANRGSVVWVDRQGVISPLLEEIQDYGGLRLSPDGRKLAVTIQYPKPGDDDIWIYDFERERFTRFTLQKENESNPVWSPDGRALTFKSSSEPNLNWILRQPIDGSGEAEKLLEINAWQRPYSWSRDGKILVYDGRAEGKDPDIWLLSMEEGRKTEPFQAIPIAQEVNAMVSPDGQWIAYLSTESGQMQIYVRPFPTGPGKWLVSTDGGDWPRWSHDGTELFYIQRSRFDISSVKVMAVPVKSSPGSFEAGKPKLLFEFKGLASSAQGSYDVAPDGRFVFIKREKIEEFDRTHLRLIFNWFDEVRAKVLTGK